MARHYFAARSPIGRHYGYGSTQFEIVGVVRDAKVRGPRSPVRPMAYRPIRQEMDYARSLEVRTQGDPHAVASEIRKVIAKACARSADTGCGHTSRARQPATGPGAADCRTHRVIRLSGVAARVHWNLWPDLVCCRPQNSRNRDPHGVGRAPRFCGLAGPSRSTDPRADRPRRRYPIGVCRRTFGYKPAIRCISHRSSYAGCNRSADAVHRGGGRISAGQASLACRPNGRAPLRVKRGPLDYKG